MVKRPMVTAFITFIGILVLFFLFLYFSVDNGNLSVFEGGIGDGRIGVVEIEGIILSSEDAIRQIKELKEDRSIKAIVIKINSPGGAVVPSQEIYEELKKVKAEGEKKIIASMGTVAASGGYYIAAIADKIFANQGTLTGSIGVIMELPNAQKLMDKIGVESVVIKSGEFKDMGSLFRRVGDKEAQLLQDVVDDIYDQFIEAVSEGREMNIEAVRQLAEGRVYTGRQALDVGLVDEIGDFEDAVEDAAKLTGIKGKPKLVDKKRKKSIIDMLETRLKGLNVSLLENKEMFSVMYLFLGVKNPVTQGIIP